MPCRAPLQAAQRKGEKPIIYKAGRRPKNLEEGYAALELPCGQCRGCRLEKSRQWGTRIACEAAYLWEELSLPSTFITLTYDQKHIPIDNSLVPEHLQKFIKKLRRRIEPNKIRYYGSGEYGSKCPKHEIKDCPTCGSVQRPHYHAIILGWAFPDRVLIGHREGLPIYESDQLRKTWGKGNHEIGSVTFESSAYVARYVMKKQTGRPVDEGHYTTYCPLRDKWFDVLPEFATMSTRPGIGMPWLGFYWDEVYENDEMPIPGRGLYGTPPKYFDYLLEKWDYKDIEEIRTKRRDAMAKSIVEGPSLESRAINQDARLNKLGRQL